MDMALVNMRQGMTQKEHPMKLFGFRWLVSDFPATLHFWRDVMGFTPAFADETMGYAYFALEGGIALELFTRDVFMGSLGQPTPAPLPAGHEGLITFQTDDVDATYADLVARGAASVAGPVDRPAWMARTAHIADPEGHLIELYTSLRTPDAPTA